MTRAEQRAPSLLDMYQRYLDDEDSARFITRVAQRYAMATLEQLATSRDRLLRRASIMALGFLGDYRCNPIVGRGLSDVDRGVRLLAESCIRQLWLRIGTDYQRQRLTYLLRLNDDERYGRTIHFASVLIEEAHWISEAWHQRGIAKLQRDWFEDAADDFREALTRNPYHYAAAIGMGQCYLSMDKPFSALQCFRDSLAIYPDMEAVRAHVVYLEKHIT